jgi:hypothetical protein
MEQILRAALVEHVGPSTVIMRSIWLQENRMEIPSPKMFFSSRWLLVEHFCNHAVAGWAHLVPIPPRRRHRRRIATATALGRLNMHAYIT